MHQVSATMRSITLSWPQPEQPNGIILDYEIRYYEKVSLLCLRVCKTQSQPLFHGWWPAEGTKGDKLEAVPREEVIWQWRPEASWGSDGDLMIKTRGSPGEWWRPNDGDQRSSLKKAFNTQALTVPTQERTFQHTTPLSGQLTGLVWAGPIPLS